MVSKRIQRGTYKGKNFSIDESAYEPRLFIDGKEIVVERVGDEYWTNLAPFTTYKKSLADLVKTLIDIGVVN